MKPRCTYYNTQGETGPYTGSVPEGKITFLVIKSKLLRSEMIGSRKKKKRKVRLYVGIA